MTESAEHSCEWKSPEEALGYLDFLGDDLFLPPTSESLDAGTLAVAYALDNHSSPGGQNSRKRSREIGAEGSELAIKDDVGQLGDDADAGSSEEKSCEKKASKGVTSGAARNKACREKQRRERINVSFLELAKLVDPGKEPKTDKSSILSDAIKVVQQLRVENNQLRQLNKFLEERVGQVERERGQQLYQYATMHQAQASSQATGLPSTSGIMPPHCVTGVPCPANANAAQQNVAAAASAMGLSLPSGGMPSSACHGSAGPGSGVQPPHMPPLSFGMMTKPMMMGQQQQQQPPAYWLPPSMLDTAQDSLLRPPAA